MPDQILISQYRRLHLSFDYPAGQGVCPVSARAICKLASWSARYAQGPLPLDSALLCLGLSAGQQMHAETPGPPQLPKISKHTSTDMLCTCLQACSLLSRGACPQDLHVHALQGVGGTTPARVAGRKLREQGLLPALLDPMPAPPAPLGSIPAVQDILTPGSTMQRALSTAAAVPCPVITAPQSSSAAAATQLPQVCQAAAAPSVLAPDVCSAAAPAAAGTHPAQVLLPAASAANPAPMAALPGPTLSAAAAGPAAGAALPAHVQQTPAAATRRYSCTAATQQDSAHASKGNGPHPGSIPWLPSPASSSLHQARSKPPSAAEQQQQQQAPVPRASAVPPQAAAPQAFALQADRPGHPQPSHQLPASSQLTLGEHQLQQLEPAGMTPPADMPLPGHHPAGSSFRMKQHASRASERGPGVPAGARDVPGFGMRWDAISAMDAQRVAPTPAAAAERAAHDDPDYDPEG